MNSDKLKKIGFKNQFNHIHAILDLKSKFELGFTPSDQNWNLRWLLKKKIIKNDK